MLSGAGPAADARVLLGVHRGSDVFTLDPELALRRGERGLRIPQAISTGRDERRAHVAVLRRVLLEPCQAHGRGRVQLGQLRVRVAERSKLLGGFLDLAFFHQQLDAKRGGLSALW